MVGKKKREEDVGYVFLTGGVSRGSEKEKVKSRSPTIDEETSLRVVDLVSKALAVFIAIVFFVIAVYAWVNNASGVASVLFALGLSSLTYVPFTNKGLKGVLIALTLSFIYLLIIGLYLIK